MDSRKKSQGRYASSDQTQRLLNNEGSLPSFEKELNKIPEDDSYSRTYNDDRVTTIATLEASEPEKPPLNWWSVLFWCTGAVFGSVMQNVYLEECGLKMPQYAYFIFWSTTIPFNLVFFLALAVAFWQGAIGEDERRVPQRTWIILGILNALNGMLLLNSNPHVPGAMQALLGPSVSTIPMSMLLSIVMLRTKYKIQHGLAVLVILGGMFIAIYPSVFQSGVTSTGFASSSLSPSSSVSSNSLPLLLPSPPLRSSLSPPSQTALASSVYSMPILTQPVATLVNLGTSGQVMSLIGQFITTTASTTSTAPSPLVSLSDSNSTTTTNSTGINGVLTINIYAVNNTAINGGGPGAWLYSQAMPMASPFSSFEFDLGSPTSFGDSFYVSLQFDSNTTVPQGPLLDLACAPSDGSVENLYWVQTNTQQQTFTAYSTGNISTCILNNIVVQASGIDAGSSSWNLLWFAGSIPLVFCSVYEERVFGEQPVHVLYMLAWSTFWQSITIYLTFPVDAIPNFGSSNSIPDIFTNQGNAVRCLFGQDISDACPDCVCEQAWWNWVLFTIGYILTNFFMLGVIKYCSATFYYVVSAISVPLSTFAFSWKALLGSDAETLSNYDYYAVAVLAVGLAFYRLSGPPGKSEHPSSPPLMDLNAPTP